jgi:DNA-binding MarR family transcriptional regulator
LNEALRRHAITATQYNVLRILRGAGANGLCGREVAERMVSRVPDVSRLLERMEGMALISRERDSGDRRHVTARLTARGLAILDQVAPALERVERARFGRLGAERLQDLIDGLAAVREGG